MPVAIEPGRAILAPAVDGRPADGPRIEVPTDFVLLATGFVADPALFRLAGVTLEGEQDAPVHDPETMETDVPGIYVAGTAVAGTQLRYRLFIENSHEHVGRIAKALTGRWPERLGTIAARSYDLPLSQIEAN